MKKSASFLLAIVITLLCVPHGVFAAGEKTSSLCGDNVLLYCPSADTLTVGDKVFKANGESGSFTVEFKVDDSDSAYNKVFLNGEHVSDMKNGVNRFTVDSADLLEGENRIAVIPGTGSATYSEEMVYGSVNLDDITLNYIKFIGIPVTNPQFIDWHLPVQGGAGTTLKRTDYREDLRIGDGWFDDTQLGGSTPEAPVFAEYIFEKPDMSGIFVIDTTVIPDGEYDFVFKKGGSVVETRKTVVDNTAPTIVFSVSDGAKVSRYGGLGLNITDLSKFSSNVTIDGKRVRDIDLSTLESGTHTVYVRASDSLGNSNEKSLIFTLTDTAFSAVKNENGKGYVINSTGEGNIYSAELLTKINAYENAYGTFSSEHLRSGDEVLVPFDKEIIVKGVDGAFPYQSFVIDAENAASKTVKLKVFYTGETGNGVDIQLKAYNYRQKCWDDVAVAISGEPVAFDLKTEDYISAENKIRVNAFPKAVYNGSDTLVWNSDTQYYSRYEDLRPYYIRINEYTVEQYKSGNIGYSVHTGDLIDRTNVGDEIAHDEYSFASEAQKILEDNNVPHGIVSGNHDIKHSTADYSYYYNYFNDARYKGFDWYGGSLNDHMHHYDLVSLGNYDFAFVYIGCYKEAEIDTINWVNSICKAYPNRNIVLCTHEYILPSGAYSGDRAEVMWNEMAVPNENVVMILCGHNEGVCNQMHKVEGTDREVLEILADYQFAENGQGPQHVENGCTCDGEGYLRFLKFNSAGQLIATTYSPVADDYGIDPYNYYPSYMDSFIYDLNLKKSNRTLTTQAFAVAVQGDKIGVTGGEAFDPGSAKAFFAVTKDELDNEFCSELFTEESTVKSYDAEYNAVYSDSVPEKQGADWFKYVNENLHINEKNAIPENVEIGLDLMPESISQLRQTSGSKTYEAEIDSSGALVTNHIHDGANWITLAKSIGASVDADKYDRLYFGVTAGKDTKWNIQVNFSGKEMSFSRNSDLAELFGYINALPSDIQGTWQGYIDLSDFVTGETRVSSVYFVSATPDQSVSFDYLFIGSSDMGKAVFSAGEDYKVAKEAPVGDKVSPPAAPYREGYEFIGWYTEEEGGAAVEGEIALESGIKTLYARYTALPATEKHTALFFDNEVEIVSGPDTLLIVIAAVVAAVAIAAVCAAVLVAKKSKKNNNDKGSIK